MLICGQTECRYCFKHYTGSTVCNPPSEPTLRPKSTDMQPDVLQCLMFKKREHGEKVNELQPGRGSSGLYPGQIRNPI